MVGEDVAIRKWGNRLYWVNAKTLGAEAESEITRLKRLIQTSYVSCGFEWHFFIEYWRSI